MGASCFLTAPSGRWRLYVVDAAGGEPKPLFSDTAGDDEQQGRVSPDGTRVAYVSDRDSDDGDRDLWVAELGARPARSRDAGDGSCASAASKGFRRGRPTARGSRSSPSARLPAASGWSASPRCSRRRRAAGACARRRPGAAAACRRAGHAGVASRRGAGLVARRQAARDREPAASRSDLQRKSRSETPTSLRRSLPGPTPSACGSSTRHFPSTPASARS